MARKRIGEYTHKAWLAGWDASIAMRPRNTNPYIRRTQRDAWLRGYGAAERSDETAINTMKHIASTVG